MKDNGYSILILVVIFFFCAFIMNALVSIESRIKDLQNHQCHACVYAPEEVQR